MSYDELRTILQSRQDLQLGTSETEEEVAAAEQQLGQLPSDYKNFLQEFGSVTFGYSEIFGLGEGLAPYLNVVTMTLAEREEGGLPPHLVPVMNDGGGNLTCLVVKQDSDDDAVVIWDHEGSRRTGPRPVAASFSEWLLGLARK